MNKKFSKYIVAIVLSLNVLFTIATMVLCALDKTIPDSLIVAWFSFTTGELVALAGIKIKDKD